MGRQNKDSWDVVFPASSHNVSRTLGDSDQGKYIQRYVAALGAKTCVLEDKYIDKDYTIDYQKFYCRSFEEYGKLAKRIHFFSMIFSSEDFKFYLINNDVSLLQESYLGFVVVKPIKDDHGQPFIGRTLLKPYPIRSEIGHNRYYIMEEYNSSLFGVKLKIRSLPFQAQDQGVSACATIALWAAIHPLRTIFGVLGHSPAEITELSTSFPAQFRKFPSDGLTMEQMVNYIKLLDLDVEFLDVIDEELIQTAVNAYMRAGLPIIASLLLKKNGYNGLHAVVLSGYKEDKSGNIVELYAHDDGIGPYSRILPKDDFMQWINEWHDQGYEVELQKFLIPIYPKIRLTFFRMYIEFLKIKEKLNSRLPDSEIKLFLTSVVDYKEHLLSSSMKNKIDKLFTSLPKFLWIIRFYHERKLIGDLIYDGTSVYVKRLMSVEYNFVS